MTSPRLVLGPVLRHIGHADATVWVETDRPCLVQILGFTERTWTVAGHHYALVTIDGLAAGACVEYDVRLDGSRAWPTPEDHRRPPSIRTLPDGGPLRIAFGSCRYATSAAVSDDDRFEPDALLVLARELAEQDEGEWPHALLMLGDQVYADETTPATQRRIAERRELGTARGSRSPTTRNTPGSTPSPGPIRMCGG